MNDDFSITLELSRSEVFREVERMTCYEGEKMSAGAENEALELTVYEKIHATGEDLESLFRFWEEAKSVSNERLKELVKGYYSSDDDNQPCYGVTLIVSRSYDDALTPGLLSSLKGFFVAYIIGRWFRLANKGEADSYIEESAQHMMDLRRKLYTRKRPRRPYAH